MLLPSEDISFHHEAYLGPHPFFLLIVVDRSDIRLGAAKRDHSNMSSDLQSIIEGLLINNYTSRAAIHKFARCLI